MPGRDNPRGDADSGCQRTAGAEQCVDLPVSAMAISLRRLTPPLPAGALAIGLVIGLLAPLVGPWLPQDRADAAVADSYVAVLTGPEGRVGLVVSARRQARVLDVTQAVPHGLPAGHSLALWQVDAVGTVRPLGRLAPGPTARLALAAPAGEALATTVGFGVTLERDGRPPERPSGPFVYQGRCGGLWRIEAASARLALR